MSARPIPAWVTPEAEREVRLVHRLRRIVEELGGHDLQRRCALEAMEPLLDSWEDCTSCGGPYDRMEHLLSDVDEVVAHLEEIKTRLRAEIARTRAVQQQRYQPLDVALGRHILP